MNTQQRIDKITEELRDIYTNTNEGPRLIAEMLKREFPYSLQLAMVPITEELEGEVEYATERIDALEDKISGLKRALEAEG
jgi:hypothetical protein